SLALFSKSGRIVSHDLLGDCITHSFGTHSVQDVVTIEYSGGASRESFGDATSEVATLHVFRAHLPVSFLRGAPDVSSGDAQYPLCLLEQLRIYRARP